MQIEVVSVRWIVMLTEFLELNEVEVVNNSCNIQIIKLRIPSLLDELNL